MSAGDGRQPVRRLQLALDHRGNRDVLARWIARDPALEAVEADEPLPDVDLVVFDAASFARNRDRLRELRAEQAPVHLPCLLATRRSDLSLARFELWRDVDDLIATPIRVDELRVRIERLLELRRRSEAAARELEELGRSNTDLQQFAFVAAHELSTPVTAVTGVIETVSARYGGELPEEAEKLLAAARSSSQRLRHMIDDLLAYSRAGHGVELRPTPLAAVISDALDELALQVEASGTRVEVGDLPVVLGDAAQLRLVFVNLLGNSIKYARPGVAPVVRVDATLRDGHWCIEVVDNGIGVEPERAESMFDLFERERHDGDRPGSGIGLALCRRILERHDGRIWIEPADGVGTAVNLLLRRVPTASR